MHPQTIHDSDLQALTTAADEAGRSPFMPAALKSAVCVMVRVVTEQAAQIRDLQQQVQALKAGAPAKAPSDEAGFPMLAIAEEDNPATGRA